MDIKEPIPTATDGGSDVFHSFEMLSSNHFLQFNKPQLGQVIAELIDLYMEMEKLEGSQ